MAFDPLSFIIGQQTAKGSGGGSSDTILLKEQTINNFVPNEEFGGLYSAEIMPPPFRFEIGKKYNVVWDGEEWECASQDVSTVVPGSVAIGDASSFGFEGNGEPFAIVTNETGLAFFAFDTKTSHTIKIYQKAESSDDNTGGGSLPKGVYWETVNINFPVRHSQSWFEYNGALYCMAYPASGAQYAFGVITYKYVDGAWTQIIPERNVERAGIEGAKFINHNGKVYIFFGSFRNITIFDGSNLTTIDGTDTFPVETSPDCVCEYNGKIYICGYSSQNGNINTLYELNDNDNTWIEVMKLTDAKYKLFKPYVINNNLYVAQGINVYLCDIDNKMTTAVGQIATSAPSHVVKTEDNNLYYLGGIGNSMRAAYIRKYNVADNTDELVGYAPAGNANYSQFFKMNGEECVIYGNKDSSSLAIVLLKPHIIE